jgi:hypothetical protein
MRQVPELLRNELVFVPLLWHAERQEEAKRRVEQLLARHPDLTQRNMRPVNVRDSGLAARLADGLTLAGLPA